MDKLVLTEKELAQMDASVFTDIALLEEKRLSEAENNDRRKKKIREDLAYVRSNKLQLLKSGVYTPESLLQEENRLNAELVSLQQDEVVSDVSMQRVMEDVQKLSELLKYGSAIYSSAKLPEKEAFVRIIFSELSISENTLKYKCKNGFQTLERRFFLVCVPTDWLSELVQQASFIQISIGELRSLFNQSN